MKPVHTYQIMQTMFKLGLFSIILFVSSATVAQNITRPNVKVPNGFEVNSYTGNLFYSRADLKVPALPLPVDISFYYNQSRRSKDWGMGPGWTFSYNMVYTPDSLGIYVERGDGRRDLFKKSGSKYISPVGVFDSLSEYQAGKFRLQSKDGMKWYFDNAIHKKLTKLEDRNINAITFTYTDTLLTQITDMAGHAYNLAWANGHLTSITDNCTNPIRKITYNYDSSYNPIKVINPLNDYVIYYYSNNKMVAYEDERGYKMSMTYTPNNAIEKIVSCITTHVFSYVAAQHKTYVTEMVNGQKQMTTYTFDTSGRVIQKVGNCCGFNVTYQYDNNNDISAVKNANNQATKYEYDAKGNLVKETDALGYSITYTYNNASKVTGMKDKNGYVTSYEYDSKGNRTSTIKPGGITEKYVYNDEGNILSYTDANNYTTGYEYNDDGYLVNVTDPYKHTVSYTYDCHGNRTAETDARKNTIHYEYNALNQIVNVKDPYDKVTKYTYDKAGNLETVTDPLNHTTTYVYDGLNRRIKTISPGGSVAETVYDEIGNVNKTIDGNGNVTAYTYNSRKQVLTESDALGYTTRYDYDEAGNRVAITDKKGNMTRYEYDELNRVKKQVNALGGTITYAYDANGNRTTESNPNGNVTGYEYDSLNRVKKITDPLKNTIAYTYDGKSNMLSEKDKNGNYTYYTYDSLGRVKKMKDAEGGESGMTYDENGNLLTETDQLNHTTQYTYDKLNRRLTVANALNELTTYTYDDAGNNKTISQPNGNVITNIYDNDNRVTDIVDAIDSVVHYKYNGNGNVIMQRDGNGNAMSYEYDALNRRTKQFDAFDKATLYGYDANGNLVKETDRNGYTKSYEYDALNRRIAETDALQHTTRFSYDANGNRTNIVDAKGNITSYTYDALSRLTKEMYADASTRQFTYDANGNRKTRKDGNGVITNYTYDKLNRMTERSYPDGTADVYSYDAAGRRETANNQNATISFKYDNANRMLSETLNGKTTGYKYDVTTRMKTLTYPGGRIITEERDKRDRLVAVKEGSSSIASFTYDAADRLLQKTFGNGFYETYTYNANNWLTKLTCQPNDVLNFEYTYDSEGNKLTALKNHRPTHSEKYVYDSIYQLTGFYNGKLMGDILSDTTSRSVYSYDALYNRTYSMEDSIMKRYYSNNVNTYDSVFQNGTKILYSYDRNGNTLRLGDFNNMYDAENRLSNLSDGDTIEIFYDAVGRRVKTVKSIDTTYSYFNQNTVIEKIDKHNSLSFILSSRLDDLLSFKNSEQSHFLLNTLMGTVYASTQAQSIKERYEYSAFGDQYIFDSAFTPISSSFGDDLISFNGRPLIFNNVHDFRARFYYNNDGRFFQKDPLNDIDSYNLYQFAYNSPPNFRDNLGLSATFPCGDYPPEICDFIENRMVKWLGALVHHTFSVETEICSQKTNKDCYKDVNCTVENVFNLMLQKRKYIAPAYELRNSIVVDGARTELYGPNLIHAAALLIGGASLSFGLYLGGVDFTNPIYSKIYYDPAEPKVVNYTIFPHIFYPGTITRTVRSRNEGVYVDTWGEGDAALPLIPVLNIVGGEAIFKSIDEMLRENYISNFQKVGDNNGSFAGGGGSSGGGGASGKY